ncbi:DUF898 family protein [Azovibrio restrictus]|uniref:DUF898 family protein n=1 Tax=Azovibrio restrictus TaxID=146938 RepID=UPI0026F1ACC6|nr:DUF898 family protein [Azovibrio restrictus]MDD3481474.1 DUF898 family protein [Azovibrio restrictus]
MTLHFTHPSPLEHPALNAPELKNHYLTLGLPDGASADAIQMAYRKAMQRFLQHQQQGRPLPAADFDALQEAFAHLKDPVRKADYDRQLLGEPPPAADGSAPAPIVPELPTSSAAPSPATPVVTPAPMPEAAPAIAGLTLEPPPPPREPPSAPHGMPEIRDPVQHDFQFTGSGGEYFRIWIVNLALSILTLGIYSAWAKVRREQYFHRNTLLDGSGFDYHGDPKAILKGRAIAWTLLLVLSATENLAPLLHPILLILLMPVVPWLIQRSLVFRARNTSYRGLRFDFHGSYMEALKVFLGYGLLTMVTFGLALPAFIRRIKLFQLNNLSFGGQRFSSDPSLGAFYGIFLRASLMAMVPMLIAGAVATKLMAGMQGYDFPMIAVMMGTFFLAMGLGYLTLLAVVQPYVQSRMANLVWNHTRVGEHLFASDQGFKSLFVLFFVNWLLTLLTLGLYWPWAKVRLAAYRAEHTALVTQDSLDDFIGKAVEQRRAVGEEIADAFDLDIAL